MRKIGHLRHVQDLITWSPLTSTMFGKFYEEIIRGWLPSQGFRVLPGKPQVYWKKQEIKDLPSSSYKELVSQLRNKKSHGNADGLIVKENHYFLWEAKNSIPELWPDPLERRIWRWPWILAQKATYRKRDYDLSGIILFWWNKKETDETLRNEIQSYIYPLSFQITYTRDILKECLEKQPKWYVDIVAETKAETDNFFKELLTRSES